jgi:hypothetical protein
MIFSYPKNHATFNPILYELNQESETKTKFENIGRKEKNNNNVTIIWEIDDIVKGQTFRIEW